MLHKFQILKLATTINWPRLSLLVSWLKAWVLPKPLVTNLCSSVECSIFKHSLVNGLIRVKWSEPIIPKIKRPIVRTHRNTLFQAEKYRRKFKLLIVFFVKEVLIEALGTNKWFQNSSNFVDFLSLPILMQKSFGIWTMRWFFFTVFILVFFVPPA